MNNNEMRRQYLKITCTFYAVWVTVFIVEGIIAVSLPTQDLTSPLDRMIPVVPAFVWFYILCYVFPFTPLALAKNWHRFNIALISVALSTLIAFVGHLAIPIAFPRPLLGSGISDQLLRIIYENDFRPGAQNFPSLHVAIAWIIFFACRKQELPRTTEYAIMLTAGMISISTVLIKQHLVIDLLGGLFLGFTTWYVVARIYTSSHSPEENPLVAIQIMARRFIPVLIVLGMIIIAVVGCQLM
jgi:membrane-associated phospholipid phosphatase